MTPNRQETDALLVALTRGLTPVRPISPWRRGGTLAASAMIVLAVVAGACGLRADVMPRLGGGEEVVQLLASSLTGTLGLLSAAMVAQPDRAAAWALLPVAPAVVWVGTLCVTAVGDMTRMSDAFAVTPSWGCLRFMLGAGMPLSAGALLLLRHAWPTRPGPVAALVAVGMAGLCSTALSLVHALDAAFMTLVWHGGAGTLLVLFAVTASRVFRGAAN